MPYLSRYKANACTGTDFMAETLEKRGKVLEIYGLFLKYRGLSAILY